MWATGTQAFAAASAAFQDRLADSYIGSLVPVLQYGMWVLQVPV